MLRRRKDSRPSPDRPDDADLGDGSAHDEDDQGEDGELSDDLALEVTAADDAASDQPAVDEDESDPELVDDDGDEALGESADPERRAAGAVALARPSVEQLSDARLLFDCVKWSRDDRAALDVALGRRSIDRVWQGPELVVGMLDEHLVEEALDDLGVGQAHLSRETDQVVYEVGEWPRVLRDSLAESLLVAGIACGWDDAADLHVSAAHEVAVDAIVEAMPDPDEVFEEAEGTEVQDLLTQLYAAVDRLKDNPKIPGARLDVVEAADRMDRLAVPFGFDANQWRDLVERAVDLREEIDADVAAAAAKDDADADDADVADVAGDADDPYALDSDDGNPAYGDEGTLTADGGDEHGASEDEVDHPATVEPARLPFPARAGQLRDRLVRLV